MKKAFTATFCVIILCSLLATLPLLEPPSYVSQSDLQTTPNITPHPALKTAPEESQNSTPQNKPPIASSQQTMQTTNDKLDVAINKAINYITQTQEPYALLLLNVLYRHFGIPEFEDSLQRYDEILSSNPQPILKIYRRIAIYNNTIDETDFNAVVNEVDNIVVPALYSNQWNLPDNYLSVLINAKNNGGYLMTHALLATIWLQENNCNISLPNHYLETLYYDTAALTEHSQIFTDLALEAAAFLYQAGQGTLVHPDFVENVIEAQNPDGGWSISSDDPNSNWHPSVLALLVLLHVEFSTAQYSPMLAPVFS